MKAYAKINIFLKIIGVKNGYHELKSRFIIFPEIYDEISFISRKSEDLIFDDKIENNIINKAYSELAKAGFKNELDEFFKSKQIFLQKNIPSGAGLGGGSSDAASFLLLANKELNLNIPKETLLKISSKIGADVAFFTSEEKAANVSGFGEIIEPFDDEIPELKLILSPIFSSTKAVYDQFDKENLNPDIKLSNSLFKQKSKEILNTYKNYELNDLLLPCKIVNPELEISKNDFLSGSGSALFRQI